MAHCAKRHKMLQPKGKKTLDRVQSAAQAHSACTKSKKNGSKVKIPGPQGLCSNNPNEFITEKPLAASGASHAPDDP